MSRSYLISLAAVVALAVLVRLVIPALPLRRAARQMSAAEALVGGLGLAGLALHCASMFFRRTVALLPGTDSISADIRALGTLSVLWYVAPAALVLLALRRQHPASLGLVALALTSVGVTMYDGAALHTHLTAIFLWVLAIAVVTTALVRPPVVRRKVATSARSRSSSAGNGVALGDDIAHDSGRSRRWRP